MPGDAAKKNHDQHYGADGHVKAMKTGQHEKRRAVCAARELQIELAVGMRVLEDLEAYEQKSKDHGQDETPDELRAVVLEEPPMRPCDRRTRGEQYQRVEG